MERIERMAGRVCVLMLLMLVIGSCVKFDRRMAWSYRALHWTKLAGETADRGLDAWRSIQMDKCLKKHGTKTEGYAECIEPTLKWVRVWTGCKKKGEAAKGKHCPGGVVLSLQSAQKGALKSLEVAWQAKKGNVMGAIKPAVCALTDFVRSAKQGGVNFGKADEAITKVLAIAAPICK